MMGLQSLHITYVRVTVGDGQCSSLSLWSGGGDTLISKKLYIID